MELNSTFIEILTEEQSMELFLRGLLPKILPPDYRVDENCFIRPHEGKTDLQNSIPRKIKAYPRFPYPVKVVIVHDQDSNDCKLLKQKLLGLTKNESDLPVLIRIACRELENWYLGDLEAVEKIYPKSKATKHSSKSKFRKPDTLNGFAELKKLIPQVGKTELARQIPQYMDLQRNKSESFNQFIVGFQIILTL